MPKWYGIDGAWPGEDGCTLELCHARAGTEVTSPIGLLCPRQGDLPVEKPSNVGLQKAATLPRGLVAIHAVHLWWDNLLR